MLIFFIINFGKLYGISGIFYFSHFNGALLLLSLVCAQPKKDNCVFLQKITPKIGIALYRDRWLHKQLPEQGEKKYVKIFNFFIDKFKSQMI